MRKSITFLALVVSVSSHAAEFDKIEELNGVHLKSAKQEAVRTYSGSTERTFSFPIELVKKGITNFTEKCNNAFKSKRQFTPENVDCKYHNENLVESFVVKDIKQPQDIKASEAYLVGRQVYNRGSFGYYELVTVSQGLNEKNQKTVTVQMKMLDDHEVKNYTSPKFSKESAFDTSSSIYTLTEVSPTETVMKYEYTAETDHWLLNKEVSVPQVFVSISQSINDLVKTVEEESLLQKRALASKE